MREPEPKISALAGLWYRHVRAYPGSEPRNKNPIVMIHGMWGNKDHFLPLQEELSKCGRATYAIDLPGHGDGRDAPTVDGLRVMDYVDAVIGFVDQMTTMHDGQVSLVGHSMGGLIAAKVAEQKGSTIGGLGLLCPAPPAGVLVRGEIWKRIWRWQYLKAIFGTGKGFNIVGDDALALMYNKLDDEGAYKLRDELGHESGQAAWDILMWRVRINHPALPWNTFLIAGVDDRMTPLAMQEKAAPHYGVYYDMFFSYEKCGHMPMIERTSDVAGHILQEMP